MSQEACSECGKNYERLGKGKYCSAACTFWSGIRTEDIHKEGCWPWQKRVRYGYGRFRYRDHDYLAHRMAYALLSDEDVFPTIYNVCGNTSCVKPEHWTQENTRDYWGPKVKKKEEKTCSTTVRRRRLKT